MSLVRGLALLGVFAVACGAGCFSQFGPYQAGADPGGGGAGGSGGSGGAP